MMWKDRGYGYMASGEKLVSPSVFGRASRAFSDASSTDASRASKSVQSCVQRVQ